MELFLPRTSESLFIPHPLFGGVGGEEGLSVVMIMFMLSHVKMVKMIGYIFSWVMIKKWRQYFKHVYLY